MVEFDCLFCELCKWLVSVDLFWFVKFIFRFWNKVFSKYNGNCDVVLDYLIYCQVLKMKKDVFEVWGVFYLIDDLCSV